MNLIESSGNMIAESLVSAATEAIFGYILDKSGLSDRFRVIIGREPHKMVFEIALLRAYTNFAQRYPQWAGSSGFFDEHFLKHSAVPILARCLLRDGPPNATELASAWVSQFQLTGDAQHMKIAEVSIPADYFLSCLDAELRARSEFQSLFDSRSLDNTRISANQTRILLENISKELQQTREMIRLVLSMKYSTSNTGTSVHSSFPGLDSDNQGTIRNIARQNYPELSGYIYDFSGLLSSNALLFGRTTLFNAIEQFQASHTAGYFWIVGDAGLGKTAIAAEITRRYDALAFFFNTSMGLKRADQCLNHLSSSLIVRYRLEYRNLPHRSGDDSAFLLSILGEVASTYRSPIWIVIDALDEIEDLKPGENPSLLPEQLPIGVYIAMTSRLVDYQFSVDSSTPYQTHRMTWDDADQQSDIAKYVKHQITNIQSDTSLDHANETNIDFGNAADKLVAASRGNFQYLAYIFSDIARTKDISGITQDAVFPKGLRGYYTKFWSILEEAEKTDGWQTWNDLYRPVIGLLGAAGEPISVEWLSDHTGRNALEVRERALR
jgi:hypothetical protein